MESDQVHLIKFDVMIFWLKKPVTDNTSVSMLKFTISVRILKRTDIHFTTWRNVNFDTASY